MTINQILQLMNDKIRIPLDPKGNPRLVRVFQAFFGILCIAIALYWVIFQFSTLNEDPTMWITIAFLIGFGIYQIAAGFGKTARYIEFDSERIILKQNSFLPKTTIRPEDLLKIEVYPLSVCFNRSQKKRIILRFGLNYTDIINPVKDAVTDFAGVHGISMEEKKEEL